ncbi:hypothetical protein N8766_04070 [bacterium]|jgi:hypothetical protein|nr:hypothetical protein [Verrucomicrobiota bacterium]MDA7633263.1 hypothetical protein [bacterium]MDA7680723.1 hypothetical protein [bacterium]
MSPLGSLKIAACAILIATTSDAWGQSENRTEVLLESPTLKMLVRDNSESPERLSGLQSLFNRVFAPQFDAYDPDTMGASAGLNFEHIISGHRNPNNKFTPRHGKYQLIQETETSTVLVRRAEDSPWRVSSEFRYFLNEPNTIDFDFECQFHEPDLVGERGYVTFFFANYMNDVIDPALHFRSVTSASGEERWIRAEAPIGHADYNGGGTYRDINAEPLIYDEDHDFKLNLWSYDYPRFTQSFYYGKAENGMCLILMFDEGPEPDEEIRFSLFKFKLNKIPRPAWDFQFVVRKVSPEAKHGFRGRLVWKKFENPDDCEKEYLRWLESRRRR